MADDPSTKPLAAPAVNPGFGRPPRSPMTVPVRCRLPSFLEFVQTQSVNVSREGMYRRCERPRVGGARVELEVRLTDGSVVLQGAAQLARTGTTGEKGMGIRFLELDDKSRTLIDRIVEVNI